MTVLNSPREYSETIPFQYQDGFTIFMGSRIKVDNRVLIPRPETEILVRAAKDELGIPVDAEKNVVDMCTGSGAIAIALSRELPNIRIKAVDISPDALEVAAENVKDACLSERIDLFLSDLFSVFTCDEEGFYDGIVANPPYVSGKDFNLLDPWVRAEPRIALYGGESGMDHLNVICAQSPGFLKQNGFLALEIGYDQSDKVRRKMEECGFSGVKSFKDQNGFQRVIIGRKYG